MKMKQLIFSLGIVLISGSSAMAQAGKLKKAESSLNQFQQLGGAEAGEVSIKFLKDAIQPIEEASVHEKTKDDPKTWTTYGLIYGNLAFIEKNAEYVDKAKAGVEKAIELDADGKNKENIDIAKRTILNYYQTVGYDAYKEQDFKTAYAEFDKGLALVPGDTTLSYFGAVAAIQNKDYANAIKKYEALLPAKDYSEHKTIVADLPKLYLTVGDTAKAIEAASNAIKEYGDDNDIALQNIEINLMAGNEQGVISDIESQIAKDGSNKSLYYYLGLANSASGKTDEALEAYKKALEIDPEYMEANLNAAAMIMNTNNAKLMALNDDSSLSTDQYSKEVTAIKSKMAEALPYLEKVVELDPSNTNALRNMKSYYDFVQDEAKATEIQAKIDAAQSATSAE